MNKLIIIITIIFSISVNSQSVLPDLNLNTLNGEEVSIRSISSNDKIAVVSLWATCGGFIQDVGVIDSDFPSAVW